MGLAGANLAAALTGGMPAAASFSRSVLMSDAGSRTRMTGVFVAALMGVALMTLSPGAGVVSQAGAGGQHHRGGSVGIGASALPRGVAI